MKNVFGLLSLRIIPILFMALVLSVSLSSCKVIKEVQIVTDTVTKTEIKEVAVHDTTKVVDVRYDSVDRYVEKISYVDTNGVVHEKEIERLIKYMYQGQEYYEAKIAIYKDSVAELEKKLSDMQTTEYVSKPLTKWQKMQISGFWVLLVSLVLYIVIRTRKWWIKLLTEIYV